MVKFVPNTPVATRTSEVVVDAGLKPGRYRFRLVVQDSRGQQSLPQDLTVVIQGALPAAPARAPKRRPTENAPARPKRDARKGGTS